MRTVTGEAVFKTSAGKTVAFPILLRKCADSLDGVLTLPDGSALLVGDVEPDRTVLVALFGEGESAAVSDSAPGKNKHE